jgi:hypothetical protein
LAGVVVAAAQLFPELPVFLALPVRKVDEQAVVTALDFLQGVTHRAQEVGIGLQDVALGVELNHRLRLVDGGNLRIVLGVAQAPAGNVASVLHDLVQLARCIKDRVVAGVEPDFGAAFADAEELATVIFAAPQSSPEIAIVRGLAFGRVDKQAMVLATQLLARITNDLQEMVVGIKNGAVGSKLDDCR